MFESKIREKFKKNKSIITNPAKFYESNLKLAFFVKSTEGKTLRACDAISSQLSQDRKLSKRVHENDHDILMGTVATFVAVSLPHRTTKLLKKRKRR